MENDKIDYGIPTKMPDDIESIRKAIEGLDYHIDEKGNKVPIKADVGIPYGVTEATKGNDPIMHPTLHDSDDLDYGIPSSPYSSTNKEELNTIAQKRKNIEIEISKTFEYTFGKIVYSPEEILNRLKETVNIIEDAYSYSPKIIDKLLGGELNKDVIYMGNNPKESSFPLYFLIDLIIKTTSTFHLEKFRDKEEILTLLAKLQMLREKSTKLDFSEQFNPNEILNENTLNDIINSKGNFKIRNENSEGINFLGIITEGYSSNVVGRNGDYYIEGESKHWESKPTTLYQKDDELIRIKRRDRVKEIEENFQNVVGKYFIDSKIPFSTEFHSKLIDKNLDQRITSILFSISLIKDKNPFYDGIVAVIAKEKTNELAKVENLIKEELEKAQVEKRKTAIEEAKERYREKSFLWKLVNKKTNPLNIDFDFMKTEEIEILYKR